jgi:hypothetical protein
MGDIGDGQREYEFEPFIGEPAEEPKPLVPEPEPVPEPEKAPA